MILKKYYEKVLLDDFLNQSLCETKTKLPYIKKISLHFNSDSSLKLLAAQTLALQLIGLKKKVTVIKARNHNAYLKVKKGSPVGSTVSLEGSLMYSFLHRLTTQVFPNHKPLLQLTVTSLSRLKNFNSFSFTIKDLNTFPELEQQFYFFKDLPPLNVTIITNTNSKFELKNLLTVYKFPVE